MDIRGLSVEKALARVLPEVDEKIRPLVEALIRKGAITEESCEGHLDRTPYPWVTTVFSYGDRAARGALERIVIIIGRWNSESRKTSWILQPFFIPFIPEAGIAPHAIIFLEPIEKNERRGRLVLQRLQKEARELGEFILAQHY